MSSNTWKQAENALVMLHEAMQGLISGNTSKYDGNDMAEMVQAFEYMQQFINKAKFSLILSPGNIKVEIPKQAQQPIVFPEKKKIGRPRKHT